MRIYRGRGTGAWFKIAGLRTVSFHLVPYGPGRGGSPSPMEFSQLNGFPQGNMKPLFLRSCQRTKERRFGKLGGWRGGRKQPGPRGDSSH